MKLAHYLHRFLYSLLLTSILLAVFLFVTFWEYDVRNQYLEEHMRNRFIDIGDMSLSWPSYSMPYDIYRDAKKREFWQRFGYYFSFNLPEFDGVQSVHVEIENDDLLELDEDLPASGKDYKKAKVKFDGEKYKAKIRYKGLNPYHWNGLKKSYKIKFKDDDYDGRDSLRLTAIKHLPVNHPYLAGRIAEDFGLYTPNTDPVTLYINGKYIGLYHLQEPFDAQFLSDRDLPDGDIYEARNINEYVNPGFPQNVYESAEVWEYASQFSEDREALAELVDTIQSVLDEGRDPSEMYEVVDRDYFVRFAAWLAVIQSPHLDYFHNNVLYYNPEIGKFYALVSDPGGFDPYLGVHFATNDLLLALHKDPEFVNDVNRLVFEKYESGEYPQKIMDAFNTYVERTEEAVEAEPFLSEVGYGYRLPRDMGWYRSRVDQILKNVNSYKRLLDEYSVKDASYYVDDSGAYSSVVITPTNVAGVLLSGFDGCEQVYRDVNRDGVLNSVDRRLDGEMSEELYAGHQYVSQPTLYQTYNIFMPTGHLNYHYLVSKDCRNPLPTLSNLLTGDLFEPILVEELLPESNFSIHPWN